LTKVYPFLAADCVYRMSETTAPATGHEGVSAKLKSWLDDSTRVQFRVLDTFAAGPIVINHRIDQFVTKQPLTWEGVGVFFVKDGRIKEWSDYTNQGATVEAQRPRADRTLRSMNRGQRERTSSFTVPRLVLAPRS
jgi:limonene-1,2-epoxide hydrolase